MTERLSAIASGPPSLADLAVNNGGADMFSVDHTNSTADSRSQQMPSSPPEQSQSQEATEGPKLSRRAKKRVLLGSVKTMVTAVLGASDHGSTVVYLLDNCTSQCMIMSVKF